MAGTAAAEVSSFDAFNEAISKDTGDGRDLAKAREIAEAYIVANPEQFSDYVNMSEHDLAEAATVFSAAAEKAPGMSDAVTRLEMWVRAKFEPQEIGGQVSAVRRAIPGFDDEQ